FRSINTTPTRNFTVDTLEPRISYTRWSERSNAVLSRNWAYIEVYYRETSRLNTTLLFNGTSYSMSCDEKNCWKNITGLNNGVYAYNVSIWDMFGRSALLYTRTLTIDS
ncbi:hypothetical protein KJ780_00110, partial [Candidatus Micrarchaeota archaeon]|nr:hypothetical protein [Candidatus Micrarchaeota archaeon]